MARADVGNNVPHYSQCKKIYCGEATAQMARNGYPNSSDRVFYTQDQLNAIIVVHNSTIGDDLDAWFTDPKALSETLQTLSALPVNWRIFATTVRAEAQAFLERSIQSTEFPVAAVVNQGQHWVLVVGWETEQDQAGNQQLQFIHYYDPWPVGVGADCTRAGSTWQRSLHFSKITIKGTWIGKFVVVGQPPR